MSAFERTLKQHLVSYRIVSCVSGLRVRQLQFCACDVFVVDAYKSARTSRATNITMIEVERIDYVPSGDLRFRGCWLPSNAVTMATLDTACDHRR